MVECCLRNSTSPLPHSTIPLTNRHPRLVDELHRVTELPLAVLPVLHRRGQHRLEHWNQVTLRGIHDFRGDLRLCPENLPVLLVRRRRAVDGSLARIALARGELRTQRRVNR